MHGDFPCKYYYLGLKCINKDCKFLHGKPLTENLKQILLKHLDTAPKEILGDFPRIGRENASKMIAQTHIKLCQEFNVPLPESSTTATNNKIPSLLDMKLKPPEEFGKNDISRNSRWTQKEEINSAPFEEGSPSSEVANVNRPDDTLLSEMRGILSDKQIDSMSSMGVTTINHINNLTVAQLNELGLSLATIGEIQAFAMNMHKGSKETLKNSSDSTIIDVDMRLYKKAKSPDTIMSPNASDVESLNESKSGGSKSDEKSKPKSSNNNTNSTIMSPPAAIDYSQYLKDSNLINDDENEDEPGLSIDETYGSDYDAEEKKDSQSEDDQVLEGQKEEIQLLPPSFDTNSFLNSAPPALAKVDISSSIQQLMEKNEKPSDNSVNASSNRDPRSRDPRNKSASSSTSSFSAPTIDNASKNSSNDDCIKSPTQNDIPRRSSIYEIESPSEDEDVAIKSDKDKDMRFPHESNNGDVDLRFPFVPIMTNYVPATEIECSYGTYSFEKYEVKTINVPKPDYSDIRRSFRQIETTQDPRLKKILHDRLNNDTFNSLNLPKSDFSSSNSSSSNNNNTNNNMLPSDPRKRKYQETAEDSALVPSPKRLQISTILQNSRHYNELSSSQKMIVNDVLAELSKQLKSFHNDPSPSKIFDTTFISQRPRLQQILIGLGVFVNADGEFEEIKDLPIASTSVQSTPQSVNIPNIHQIPPTIMPSLLQQPPPNLMMQPPPNLFASTSVAAAAALRPGLLGMAPNLASFNFDAQDPFGASMNQQQNNFNDQNNFNNMHNNSNNRNQQRQNNNFRNNNNQHRNNNSNSNSNNSNYRNNRR
jgi:hypothetical protein